jgi:diacylglycerol kinase family enzyme
VRRGCRQSCLASQSRPRAARRAIERADALLVAGGDGTLNIALRALLAGGVERARNTANAVARQSGPPQWPVR